MGFEIVRLSGRRLTVLGAGDPFQVNSEDLLVNRRLHQEEKEPELQFNAVSSAAHLFLTGGGLQIPRDPQCTAADRGQGCHIWPAR